MLKRLFDIVSSLIVLTFGFPFFIIAAILITVDSKGGVFFRQVRVGKNNVDFKLFKFRTMKPNSEGLGQITVGGRDPRITTVGYWLRRFKLDEFPQLINVLIGDMSVVGPRPEVRRYVSLYNKEQLKVLSVRPGLTDYASLEFMNENELLEQSSNPNETYINEVMPAKLALNQKYIAEKSMLLDLQLIFKTVGKLFKN
jgi:lipopolysaccharide/colanic/teichoic acid biosynthesis glycosyltransferase